MVKCAKSTWEACDLAGKGGMEVMEDKGLLVSFALPGRQRRLLVYLLLALLTTLFAWGFSALPPSDSSGQSGWLKGLVDALLGTDISETLLRKLAHVTEYALIGIFASLTLLQTRLKTPWAFVLWLLCLFIALVDETIQIFSGRGPAIVDVWIDGAGAALGMSVVLVLQYFAAGNNKKGYQVSCKK